MARSFGRLLASIWDDKDFHALSVPAKLMYGFVISQPDLEHSGIIPLRYSRWARLVNMPAEDVVAAVKELDEARFTVTDEEEGELLVRSLIRRDDVWKQPNVFKSAAASAKAARSAQIKAALYREILRLDLARTGRETQTLAADLLTHLEPFANPSPNPPEGFPRGSGSPGEHIADGSHSPREGLAKASAGPQGKGEGYGPVLGTPLPPSPTPSPVAAPEPVQPPRLAVVPDARAEGEGGRDDDQTLDLTALVARVREMRPDWSTKSITRAMADESVTERPWPLAVTAMLAVAADPVSEHPGRVAHDGPWWKPPAREAPKRPPWCQQCRESTRRLEDEDGYDAGPCPRCNPRAEAS